MSTPSTPTPTDPPFPTTSPTLGAQGLQVPVAGPQYPRPLLPPDTDRAVLVLKGRFPPGTTTSLVPG